MSHVVIGTAGHIDHGKTALVKALTGKDTDSLPEEKSRGVTIDIGFAFLGDDATIIDVPGHERFIKNMVTGVSTISYVIFVIAADDGLMPQTREHLDILSLLGVEDGMIVINKIDLVEENWLDMVIEDVKKLTKGTFLENASIFKASAINGDGIKEIKETLIAVIADRKDKVDKGYFRLPVDRSFSVKGFGTVVTGTVVSGSVRKGESVEILPAGIEAKVRGIQQHNEETDEAKLGERTALNLSGVSTEDVIRGSHIAAKNYLNPTMIFEANLNLLGSAPKPLSSRTRVRLHLGTGEVMGRISLLGSAEIEPGGNGFVQVFLEKEVPVAVKDKFIIRRYSPPLTIGGGVVLKLSKSRYKAKDKEIYELLKVINEESDIDTSKMLISRKNGIGIDEQELGVELGIASEKALNLLKELEKSSLILAIGQGINMRWYGADSLTELKESILSKITDFFKENPVSVGIKLSEIKELFECSPQAFDFIIEGLTDEKKISKSGELISMSGGENSDTQEVEDAITSMRYSAATSSELAKNLGRENKEIYQLIKRLIQDEKVIRLDGDFFIHVSLIEELKAEIEKHFEKNGELSVSDLKNITGVSRKYAIPLLQFLDENSVTRREGNVRVKA
ncbi:selenocysteine-specific translation elongation factor [Candidatus Marinimicrobia bacterium MT.SAG.3]|nr:selenocysteine-specific translation elongation factor [Candidatus Marinimicrobia bacterium MT.SAG.3]